LRKERAKASPIKKEGIDKKIKLIKY